MSESRAPSLGQEMLASGVGGCLADGLTYPMWCVWTATPGDRRVLPTAAC